MTVGRARLFGEVVGVFALASTAFVAISLYTYSAQDPSFNSYLTDAEKALNAAGLVGAWISDLLIQTFGAISVVAPLALLYIGIGLVRGAKVVTIGSLVIGIFVLSVALSAIASLYWEVDPLFSSIQPGGMAGALVAEKVMKPWLSVAGSYVVLGAVVTSTLLLTTRLLFSKTFENVALGLWKIKGWSKPLAQYAWSIIGKIKLPSFRETEEAKKIKAKKQKIREKVFATEIESVVFDEAAIEEAEAKEPAIVTFDLEEPPPLPPGRGSGASLSDRWTKNAKKRVSGRKKPEEENTFQQEIFSLSEDGEYQFPPLKLLDTGPKVNARQTKDDLIKSSKILEQKLLDFGIEGRVTQVLPGPVITIFEFEPAPGVKVARIASLSDDLAMSLRALSIRILAPIPGKSVVGIEVPNVQRESVFLKEILSSEEFTSAEAAIPLALGRNVAGVPVAIDLASVPHLLIAGSTGSGKSVGINAMICSIIFRLTPSEVKFIMIDPKMLELSIYDGIPHLISPVVTSPKKASNALKWVVGEMERRYRKLSELGVRNINNYNKLVTANLKDLARKGLDPEEVKQKALETALEGGSGFKDPLVEKLPFIVVVIDELADLMMVSSKDVEDSLARLAQMARAAGIHLIVATQRPSVDVLTGLIKANFPARMSFQVRSRVDSRTIIDSMGAEKLLGRGDMLYLAPGASEMARIQGPFVSDDEIHRVVDFLKDQSEPEYNDDILAPVEEEGAEELEEDMDEYYHQAVELVTKTRQASISMIQRRLRIGYNRAARIVEVMEKQGLVGPADGSKPREVFMRPNEDVETTYN